MQEDTFVAAEKILCDIENVVKKNPSLKSFEIIPAEVNENKSPLSYQEECLGLASWCIKPLYCYIHHKIFAHRQNKQRREESNTVARWLMGALLLNPDVTSFWNMRRELISNHHLNPTEELLFIKLVLSRTPMCSEAFAYRRWLVPFVLDAKEKSYDPIADESPLCNEINIATTCADRYASNYHAWSHRRHIINLKESRARTHPTYESEWKETLEFCQRHISDNSAFSYRQFLLRKCIYESNENNVDELTTLDVDRNIVTVYIELNLRKNNQELASHSTLNEILNFIHGIQNNTVADIISEAESRSCFRALSYLIKELQSNEGLLKVHIEHEVLWSHRRFLAYVLTRLIASYQKYSRYHDQFMDPIIGMKSQTKFNETSIISDQHADILSPLEIAFLYQTREIIEIASKHSRVVQSLAHKFVKFLDSIGLQL